MSNASNLTATRIARELHAFESQLAATIATAAKLTGSLASARTMLDVSPAVGHETMLRFSKVTDMLLRANGEVARGHNSLRRDADILAIVYEDTPKEAIHRDEAKAA